MQNERFEQDLNANKLDLDGMKIYIYDSNEVTKF